MIRQALICILLCFGNFGFAEDPLPSSDAINGLLGKQKARLLREQKNNYWHYPMYMGVSQTSLIWLVSNWLGTVSEDWDTQHLKTIILKEQLPNGSWQALPDPSDRKGDLNVTIINYWALKSMGLGIQAPSMSRARQYILKNGGAEAADKFIKIFLIAFANQPWSDYPTIPQIPWFDLADFVMPNVARWIRPNVHSILYLYSHRVAKNIGESFRVQELYKKTPKGMSSRKGTFLQKSSSLDEARRLYWDQRAHGSWGGTSVSTMFNQMALQHAGEAFPSHRLAFQQAIDRGNSFLRQLSFNTGASAYQGVTLDGRYWDTALVGQTLAELGVETERLQPAADYLLKVRQFDGGYSFGIDFEQDPDTDDTAEILLFFHRISLPFDKVKPSILWLLSMQNDDGGWAAFDRNNTGDWFMRKQAEILRDTADLFDESSADVTGHVIEALAAYGLNSTNSPIVQKGIDYLEKNQHSDGSWYGRWGVNYLYGTSAAIVGLRAAGIPPTHPMFQKANLWLQHCQNRDGGFGETFETYKKRNKKCQGVSTPSQTAWALLALLEMNPWDQSSITRAVNYLVRSYGRGDWTDPSINGTGQPVKSPMQYLVYPKVFPTIALLRYLKMRQRILD